MTEIRLFGDIGAEITDTEFIREFEGLRGDVTLRINSGGGSFFTAVAIVNAIRRSPANTTAIIDGLAASAASFIAIAAKRTLMTTGSYLMIHEASGFTQGAADEHGKTADTLNRISDTIAAMYAVKAGGTQAQWRQRMKEETWYDHHEAVSAGLADGIAEEPISARTLQRQVDNMIAIEDFEIARVLRDELPQMVAAALNPVFRTRAERGHKVINRTIDRGWR